MVVADVPAVIKACGVPSRVEAALVLDDAAAMTVAVLSEYAALSHDCAAGAEQSRNLRVGEDIMHRMIGLMADATGE